MKRFILVALVTVLTTAACNNSSSSTSPTLAPPTTMPTTITGIVPAAVNGVGQSDSQNFTVGQSGGAVTVTLTSAVETFPNGSLNPAVVMGLAVGSPNGTTCTLPTGTIINLLQGSATSTLSGTLGPGTYCVQVSDQTVQTGPVAYTVVVVAP
jgi:hypothetical protein